MIWTSADLPVINKAAEVCVKFITDGLTEERGVHLETAISTAGCLAGVSILRSAVLAERIDLSKLISTKPGSPVFIEKANEIGAEVSELMVLFCEPLGINPQTGWTQEIPEDHTALRQLTDLVRDFEKPFIALMDKQSLRPNLRPFAAGLAAMKLTVMGMEMLNPDICKALALSAMVASSKTIPSN